MIQWNGSKKIIATACKIFDVHSLKEDSMVLKKHQFYRSVTRSRICMKIQRQDLWLGPEKGLNFSCKTCLMEVGPKFKGLKLVIPL